MRFRRLTLAIFLCAAVANAGVLVKQTMSNLGDGTTATSEISMDENRLKIETHGSGHDNIFLYLAGEDRFYIIDSTEGTYRTFTRQQFEQMFDQASQMTAMLEEKLKDLPPQQRAMVERMMKEKMGAAVPAQVEKTVFRKVGSEAVSGWSCDKYEGHRSSEMVEEVWTTSPSEFGLSASDFRIFDELASMFEGLAQRMNVDVYRIGNVNPAEGEYGGVPVQRITYRNGKAQQRHQVTEASRQDFADGVFAVPSGLRELETPMMGGR